MREMPRLYDGRKNLGGDEIDMGKMRKPYLVPNISFNSWDAMRQNVCTGPHPVTIQSPSGNDSSHPLGNTRRGPYTNSPRVLASTVWVPEVRRWEPEVFIIGEGINFTVEDTTRLMQNLHRANVIAEQVGIRLYKE